MRLQQPRPSTTQRPRNKRTQVSQARRKTIADLAEDFLILHKSQQYSPKTIEWHATAIGLLVRFLEASGVNDPLVFETNHLRHWVVWLGTPESMRWRKGYTIVRPVANEPSTPMRARRMRSVDGCSKRDILKSTSLTISRSQGRQTAHHNSGGR